MKRCSYVHSSKCCGGLKLEDPLTHHKKKNGIIIIFTLTNLIKKNKWDNECHLHINKSHQKTNGIMIVIPKLTILIKKTNGLMNVIYVLHLHYHVHICFNHNF